MGFVIGSRVKFIKTDWTGKVVKIRSTEGESQMNKGYKRNGPYSQTCLKCGKVISINVLAREAHERSREHRLKAKEKAE